MNLKKSYNLYSYFLYQYFNMLKERKFRIHTEDGGLDYNLISPDLRRKMRILYEIKEPSERFNIFSEEGLKFVFNGNLDRPSLGEGELDNAKKFLKKNVVYTLKTCIPLEMFTFVEVKELPGMVFNSARFSNYDAPAIKKVDELLAEYGPDLESDCEMEMKAWEAHKKRLENDTKDN